MEHKLFLTVKSFIQQVVMILLSLALFGLQISSSWATPESECELFLAESTIPHAGLGIFTAIEKKPDETISNGDVAFPIIYRRPRTKDPFQDYGWDGMSMGMGRESTLRGIDTIWPGLFCIVNCMIPLVNVKCGIPLHLSHRDELPYLPHRSTDPGAGAITTYRAVGGRATRRIPPGGEVFVSYGNDWFTSRPEYFDEGFPLADSFREAQAILDKYTTFEFPPLYASILEIREVWTATSRVLNALPVNDEQLKVALENDIAHIYQKNATRSLKWLQTNGVCVDHIVHKPSGIAGAGEGAFAKRRLPKGTVITGTPLLTITDQSLLDVPDSHSNESDYNDRRRRYPKQILYNYCFGHESTSLLFFPYGAVGALFMNHGGRHRANVEVKWADPGRLRHNPTWLERRPDQLDDTRSGPQLGIEYISMTDIEEGEELFLDYGDKWDEAWREHVRKWRPPEVDSIASDWNDAFDPIRTNDEQVDHPYPSSIELRCHVDLLEPKAKWTHKWTKYGGRVGYGHLDVYGLPCEILHRSTDNLTYTVALCTDDCAFVDVPTSQFDSDGEFIRDEVPREAIFFLDAPYESDLFLEGAFRFPMQLPDAMIPKIWRDVENTIETARDEL